MHSKAHSHYLSHGFCGSRGRPDEGPAELAVMRVRLTAGGESDLPGSLESRRAERRLHESDSHIIRDTRLSGTAAWEPSDGRVLRRGIPDNRVPPSGRFASNASTGAEPVAPVARANRRRCPARPALSPSEATTPRRHKHRGSAAERPAGRRIIRGRSPFTPPCPAATCLDPG